MSIKDYASEIIELYKSGIGSDTIGKKFKFHPNYILRFLKKEGIEIRGLRKKIFEEEEKEIVRLYKEGISAPKIAEKFGIENTMVLRYLEKNGVPRRSAEECHRKFAIQEDFFENIDTQEKAYVLGFMFADGANNLKGNFSSINLSETDIDILYKISKLIYKEDSEKQIKFYTRKRFKNGQVRLFKEIYITFNSKHMCEKLNELGCTPKKSLTLKFPESLTDSELQRHFIRGYYDGDGGVYLPCKKGRATSLKIISTLEFNTKIAQIIKDNIGITFYERNEIKDKNIYTIRLSGSRKIETLLDWLYKDSIIHLDRKYNKYMELLEQIKHTNFLINEGTQGYRKNILANNAKYRENNKDDIF